MNPTQNPVALGAPEIEPRWTSSAKEGPGTAYHTSCRVWFTLSHGIVNEIYYQCVDEPNTRDFQFLITDGETFCHEEKRDLDHYALLAPHIARQGAGNSGWGSETGGHNLLNAERKGVHLVMGCSERFSQRSVGFVGASDGWQDLTNNFRMDWEFRAAGHGNIALTGEIVPQGEEPFTVAIALGKSCIATITMAMGRRMTAAPSMEPASAVRGRF